MNPILFIKMPQVGATYPEWYNYNNLMYKIMKLKGTTQEEKAKALENLMLANEPMFRHKAQKLKVDMYSAATMEDALQIERLQFLQVIHDCLENKEPCFPSKARVFGYGCERELYEEYRTAGVVMSYATKKRRVADETYKMTSTELDAAEFERTKKNEGNDSEKWLSELDQLQMKEGLDRVMDTLTEKERLVFLAHVDGMTNQEIADQIGLKTEGAIRYQLNMITKKLQRRAKKEGLEVYLEAQFQ